QLIEEHTPRLAKEFSSFKSRSQVQLSEIIVKYVQFWQNHPNIPILLTRGGLSQDFESRKKLEESRFNHVTKQTLYSALKKVPGCNDMNIDYYYMLVSSLSTQPYLNIDNNEACSKFNITDYTRVLEDLKFSAPSMC
ncbi:TetR/AcrR family transcriptional regulator, partial [Vibrio penaeicida]